MLAQLKGLFTPQAIAASMKLLTPLETTIMDTLFKDHASAASDRRLRAGIRGADRACGSP